MTSSLAGEGGGRVGQKMTTSDGMMTYDIILALLVLLVLLVSLISLVLLVLLALLASILELHE